MSLPYKVFNTHCIIHYISKLDYHGFYENSSGELETCHFSRYIFMNSLPPPIHSQLHMRDLS